MNAYPRGEAQEELLDGDQMNIEHERRVRRNYTGVTRCAVSEIGGDGNLEAFADFHAGEGDIPALNDLARPQNEGERLATINRRIKRGAIGEETTVMHNNGLTGFGTFAPTFGERLDG